MFSGKAFIEIFRQILRLKKSSIRKQSQNQFEQKPRLERMLIQIWYHPIALYCNCTFCDDIILDSPQDAHGNQFGQTVKDKSQDYRLIVGYQYQENTVLRFKRKINTCDGEDLAITVGC